MAHGLIQSEKLKAMRFIIDNDDNNNFEPLRRSNDVGFKLFKNIGHLLGLRDNKLCETVRKGMDDYEKTESCPVCRFGNEYQMRYNFENKMLDLLAELFKLERKYMDGYYTDEKHDDDNKGYHDYEDEEDFLYTACVCKTKPDLYQMRLVAGYMGNPRLSKLIHQEGKEYLMGSHVEKSLWLVIPIAFYLDERVIHNLFVRRDEYVHECYYRFMGRGKPDEEDWWDRGDYLFTTWNENLRQFNTYLIRMAPGDAIINLRATHRKDFEYLINCPARSLSNLFGRTKYDLYGENSAELGKYVWFELRLSWSQLSLH